MNRKLLIAIGAIALAAAGIAGGYWFAMHRMMSGAPSTDAAAAAAGKKPLYWHDPMYPQHKFDKPGKSPFMDMMLVPVYGDSGGDASSVAIDSRVVQNLGVRTEDVKEGALDPRHAAVAAVRRRRRRHRRPAALRRKRVRGGTA